jgi:hypothetical protein
VPKSAIDKSSRNSPLAASRREPQQEFAVISSIRVPVPDANQYEHTCGSVFLVSKSYLLVALGFMPILFLLAANAIFA